MILAETLEVEGGPAVGRLVLPSGHITIFDEADRALVEQYQWRIDQQRRVSYVRGHLRGTPWLKSEPTTYLHRVLLGAPQGVVVDHRNGDGLDNRRINLRLATTRQNLGNMRAHRRNTSGYKGVSWDRSRQRWVARCRGVFLGAFADPWEAAQAYNTEALRVWGEFARLNERRAS